MKTINGNIFWIHKLLTLLKQSFNVIFRHFGSGLNLPSTRPSWIYTFDLEFHFRCFRLNCQECSRTVPIVYMSLLWLSSFWMENICSNVCTFLRENLKVFSCSLVSPTCFFDKATTLKHCIIWFVIFPAHGKSWTIVSFYILLGWYY